MKSAKKSVTVTWTSIQGIGPYIANESLPPSHSEVSVDRCWPQVCERAFREGAEGVDEVGNWLMQELIHSEKSMVRNTFEMVQPFFSRVPLAV